MTKALDRALFHAKSWLERLDDHAVAADVSLETLRSRFAGPLPARGMALEDVIGSLAERAEGGLLGYAGGRFFAWVAGGSLQSALAADWLVSTWDQNAALYACGPAVAVIEEVAGEWIKELLDLPREASFAFTTGCQLAHLTGLAAARHAQLKKLGWDVEEQGLFDAPKIRVLASDQAHGSIERAVRVLGLGRGAVQRLATNDRGVISAATLERALTAVEGPVIVILNAADLNVGACDPFSQLIPIAHDAGAWVHVDGAFGLIARASRSRRPLLEGVELADSWATDAHKWLNVPFDCGIAIVRDAQAHKSAMTVNAAYIAGNQAARDQIDWNPEWSRRARGVPVYAMLQELGAEGVAAMVDRCCDHCLAIVEGIGALPGAEIVARPVLNQGLVRFSAGGTTREDDRYTDEVLELINATGEAFFSGTTWSGRRAMRVSVVNWRTSENDVRRAVAAAASALASCRR